MSTKTTAKTKKKGTGNVKARRVSKLNVWMKHYTNESNPSTFLNKTESARAAQYQAKDDMALCSIGCQNFNLLSKELNQWFDEVGLSETALKKKLLSLTEAKETKFQTMKGAVNPDSLPPNVNILATTGVIEHDEEGGMDYGTGDTLLAIGTDAIEIQRKTLDMALKVKGLYAPEKKEVTGKNGEAIKTESVLSPELIELFKEIGIAKEKCSIPDNKP